MVNGHYNFYPLGHAHQISSASEYWTFNDDTNLNALANPKFPCLIKLVMNSVNFSSRVLFRKST